MTILLNLGSGGHSAPENVVLSHEEIHVDVVALGVPCVRADVRTLPFDDGSVDAVYASHLIEHIAEYEVVPTLCEWRRVLKLGGKLTIYCPDAQSACAAIADHGVDAVLYVAGNHAMIRGQDVLFGWIDSIMSGNDFMRHKVAFDQRKLAYSLAQAGFTDGEVRREPSRYLLEATCLKT